MTCWSIAGEKQACEKAPTQLAPLNWKTQLDVLLWCRHSSLTFDILLIEKEQIQISFFLFFSPCCKISLVAPSARTHPTDFFAIDDPSSRRPERVHACII